MINGQRVLAVIPARGGSVRCPGKNIRPFRGKPLLVWTIEAAQQSKYIDKIVVSSDDAEILSHPAVLYYALVRPAELATDAATSEDALRHALALFPADIVVLLQPTSPLRIAEDIDATIIDITLGLKHASVSVNEDTGEKNGAVYASTADWLRFHDFTAPTLRYFMPASRSLDIDYPEQFEAYSEQADKLSELSERINNGTFSNVDPDKIAGYL